MKNMGNNAKSTVKNQPRDWTVYQVCAAFVMMVAAIVAAQHVIDYYATGDGFGAVYDASRTCVTVCAVLFVAAVAARVALKTNPVVKTLFPYVTALSALLGLSALDLRYFWVEHAVAIYLAHATVYGLYIVYRLYRGEFFCFSLATVLSGCCFYFYSRGLGPNLRTVLLALMVSLALVGVSAAAYLAAKNKGKIKLFGASKKVFDVRFNPTVLYVTCAVLACCLVLSLVLGPAFAYYCAFAAVAIELIGAVYYTFQLK